VCVTQEWSYDIIPPASKLLACNEFGRGALADVTDIVQSVTGSLGSYQERRKSSGVGSWKVLGFDEWQTTDVSDC